MSIMTRGPAAVSLAVMVAVAGCTGGSAHNSAPVAPNSATTPTTGTVAPASCPAGSPGPNGSGRTVDYVDFIQAYGQQYIAGLGDAAAALHVERRDLGPIVLRSRCSFAQLNDRYGVIPPDRPGDGDTAFLPPGTPIHIVRGWSPQCRLAATENGQLRLFLAYRNDTKVATPRACALHH